MKLSARDTIASLLRLADIEINGTRPWDIKVNDERLYDRVLAYGSLGLGEAYMDGWWDSEALDDFFCHVLGAQLSRRAPRTFSMALSALKWRLMNLQRPSRAFEVGKVHYDVGNDLYQAMLDRRLTYTCAYWKDAHNLDEAQEAKLDLVCRKLGLKEGNRVLDIGCGWGSFLKFAAERYGIQGVGVTVSEAQFNLGRELCRDLPIEILLKDYRDVRGTFDHVVSLGMFEHVGYKNYRTYMQVVHRLLANDGLFLLQTIGSKRSSRGGEPWTNKYIFPNSMLPSIAQIGGAIENVFVMEDWHSFGADYERTLIAWYQNFERAWPRLKERYGERFYRMWKYYLQSFVGSFRAHENQLWQVVFSKGGVSGGYRSMR